MVDLLVPIDFSLTEVLSESLEVSGIGGGSGTVFSVLFVVRVSGGAPSESEES